MRLKLDKILTLQLKQINKQFDEIIINKYRKISEIKLLCYAFLNSIYCFLQNYQLLKTVSKYE